MSNWKKREGSEWLAAVKGWWFVQLLLVGMGLCGLPGRARAQQEAKFLGWSGDGQAVVEDESKEISLKCKARGFNGSQAAPGKGCTPCASKKACAVEGAVAPASDSPDGAVHAETAKESKGILVVTVKGEAAPRRLSLRAGRTAQVTTWFRADSKALAIRVHDAEDRIFVVDLNVAPVAAVAPRK